MTCEELLAHVSAVFLKAEEIIETSTCSVHPTCRALHKYA
jgi:hypothetical protein